MRRRLAALATLPLLFIGSNAQAAPGDPVGDLIMSVVTGSLPSGPGWNPQGDGFTTRAPAA